MAHKKKERKQKHYKGFWPVFVIVVVAVVAAGVVLNYAFNTELQADLYSVSFTSPIQIHKSTKPPVKKVIRRTVTPTPTAM